MSSTQVEYSVPPELLTKWNSLETKIDEALLAERMVFKVIGQSILAIRAEPRIMEEVQRRYGTLEDYCQKRFELGSRRVRQMTSACEVWNSLEGKVPVMPENEYQIRPLLKLEKPVQREKAWKRIIAEANTDTDGDPIITNKLVETIVDKLVAEFSPKEERPTTQPAAERRAEPSKEPTPADGGAGRNGRSAPQPILPPTTPARTSAPVEEEETDWSIDDSIKAWNKAIDEWCRKLNDIVKDMPEGMWIDKNSKDTITGSIKAAKESIRSRKAHGACPKCKGTGCKQCRKTGFMPKIEHQSHGGS